MVQAQAIPPGQVACASWGCSPTSSHARCTPWSVFQDGQIGGLPPASRGRRSRRPGAPFRPRSPRRQRRPVKGRGCPAELTDADQHPAHTAGGRSRRQPGRTRDLQSLPPQQFQALFNSLFKVLFIFPSRYLFAIGLPSVFSLRWDLPPALGCIPKQPDSAKAPREAAATTADGVLTLSDASFQRTWAWPAAESTSLDYNSPPAGRRFSSWALPGSLAATRGILVSFFSSAY